MHTSSNLSDHTAVVTGANAGLGFHSALTLARQGARVVIACRSEDKGHSARQRILAEVPQAQLDVIPLDLSEIASVKRFAMQFYRQHHQLDILMNNAGVVNLESLQRNAVGQELHMATNHLGHFALTAELMPALLNGPHPRVVTLSSGGYKVGQVHYDDFNWEKRPYHRMKAYGDSKLANLLFTLQLQRYFEQKGSSALSLAAHPGLTATERQQSIGIGGWLAHWLATPVAQGCRPQLLAATHPDVVPGGFYGPKYGLWGPPALKSPDPKIVTTSLAKSLWLYSEELTNSRFP